MNWNDHSFSAPRRLPELEGLRGLLSWWVVVCHAPTHLGYTIATLGRGWRILAHGDYAVEVFIILSGFVIHKLWYDAREPYRSFIARRFLRLWPAYVVWLFAALARWPPRAGVVAHALVGDPEFSAHSLAVWQQESAHYWPHVIAQVTTLQSAVPETHLPGSAVAFLGHMLVIWLLQAAAFSWIGNLTPPCLLVLLLGLGAPLTLLLSIALHRWIEMPGIGLGRRLNLR